MRFFANLTALFTAFLLATAAQAATTKTPPAQAGRFSVQSIVEQVVEVKQPDGTVQKKRQPVEKAAPGSEVIYTTRFTNMGNKPAGNIVINNPVPANTAYVSGSAFGDAKITYSIDGKTFDDPDNLIVKTAEGRERPALPSDYVAIRWAVNGEVAPGKTGEIGFSVKIK